MDLGFRSKHQPVWKVVGKGMVAGFAGTGAMTLAQTQLLSKIPTGFTPGGAPRFPAEPEGADENATETAARRIFEGLGARHLSKRQKARVSQLVHYGSGAAWGGLFGLLVPRRPTVWEGMAWGLAVWIVGDNLLAPALRFSDWPWRYPTGVTARGLLAHLVYGAGTAALLRATAPKQSLAERASLAHLQEIRS